METAIGEIHAQPILFTLQQTSPVKHFTSNTFLGRANCISTYRRFSINRYSGK